MFDENNGRGDFPCDDPTPWEKEGFFRGEWKYFNALLRAERSCRDMRSGIIAALIQLNPDIADPIELNAPPPILDLLKQAEDMQEALTSITNDAYYGCCINHGYGRFAGLERTSEEHLAALGRA